MMTAVGVDRCRFRNLLLTAALLGAGACGTDEPAPHPECLDEDGCPTALEEGDAAIAETAGDTTPLPRSLVFSIDTQVGEKLVGSVTTAQIAQNADKDPAVAGVQVDVSITTENVPDGATLEVYLNGQRVGGPAQVLNNKGRVNGITVPCTAPTAPNGLAVRAIVDAAKGEAVVGKDKTLVVTCGAACKATIDPLAQSCLTQDQDPTQPGFQQTFIVHSDQSDCTDAYLLIQGGPGVPTESAHVPLNGSTSVPILATLAIDDTGLIGVTATVTAVVEDTAHPERGSVASAPVTAKITTDAPTLTVLKPTAAQLKLSDDQDPLTPGIQVPLIGSATSLTTADKNAIELYVDGTLTTKTTLLIDGTFVIPLSFATTGTRTLLLKATSGCGLSAQKSQSLAVFVEKANLQITSPQQDAVLQVADDLDKSTPDVLELNLAVAVSAETADVELRVYCKSAGAPSYPVAPLATLAYPDVNEALVTIPLALAVQDLGQTITCKVADDAPNQGQSPEVTFVAGLPPPCLQIVQPAHDVTITALTLDVLLATSHLDGQMVQAYWITAAGVPLDAVDLGVPVTNHLASQMALFADGAWLPDGVYTLTFQAADKWGNLAGQSLCSDVTRTVTLDTTPPTLVVTLPVKATLTTLDDPDSNPAVPGYQVDVEVTVTDADSVCLFVEGVQIACQTKLAEGTAVVLFKDVTLQPGLNALTVTGSDANGNTSAPAPTFVNLVSDVPVVKFVKPSASTKVASDALTFTVAVTQPGDGAPVLDATLDVRVNGASVAVTTTALGAGLYSFDITGLSNGKTTVQVGAYVAAAPEKEGFSGELTITYKAAQPAAALVTPYDGQIFNAANTDCAIGQQDCSLTAFATFADVEDGSTATVTVTCTGNASGTSSTATYSAKVKNSLAAIPSVKLLDQSSCDLALAVTDAALQTALAPVAVVAVDRLAPVIGKFVLPLKAGALTLLANDDLDNDPTDGMQIPWSILVAGIPAGATVTCETFDDLGKQKQGPFIAHAPENAPDGVAKPVPFQPISLVDGYKVSIVCSTADAANNKVSKTFFAEVHSDAPDIRITGVDPSPIACSSNAGCGFGLCHLGGCVQAWNKLSDRKVGAFATGLPDAAPIRLCSDTPGLTGPACQTAGYVAIKTGNLSGANGAFDMSAQVDGKYHWMIEAFHAAANQGAGTWISSLASPFTGSRERNVLIDTVPPAVATVVGPSAPGTPAACLTQAEQSTADGNKAGGQFPFAVTMANEDASVTLLVNGLAAGTVQTTAKVGSLAVTIAAEGTATFEAVAVDFVGNVSDLQELPARFVDTLPPLGDFATPSKSPIILGDSRDVQVVSVSGDVEAEPVTVRDLGVFKAVQAFLSNHTLFADATFHILSDGDHTLTADLRDHCANPTTIGTSPVVISVDTAPPGATITSPSEGALFTDSDDAAPSQGGYQVALSFTTAGASSWKLELGTDCDPGSQSCVAFQPVGSGSVVNPGGAEAPVLVTVPFGNTVHYKLRLTVTDAAGNSSQIGRGFDVILSGCLVKLSGLPGNAMLNTQNCATPGANCASVNLGLTASFVGPCGAATAVKLQKAGVDVASVTPVGQAAAFNIAINDGDNTSLEAIVMDNTTQKGSSGKLTIAADLSNPTVSFAAATVLGAATVAGSTALEGKAQDRSGTSPDHEVHLQLALADAHLSGGALTALTRTAASATVALPNASVTLPVALVGTSAALDVQFASLLADQVNTITATVTDSFGNTGTGQLVVTVDWTPPAAITLDALTDADLNPRRPAAVLHFAAVGDNGVSGTATSYIVRYAKKAMASQADFDAACDASAIPGWKAPSPSASGSAESLAVSGPDGRDPADLCKFVPFTDNGLSSYAFAVVAVDAAGNKGAMSNVVATAKLRLNFLRIVNSGIPGSTFDKQDFRARVFGLGDLNGDGFGDVGLGGGATTPFCVLYGRPGSADIDLASEPAGSLACIPNGGGLGGRVGAPADVNGDGITDLVIGNKTGSGIAREILVFLGQKDAAIALTPAVTITGFVNTIAAGQGPFRADTAGNFNGDVSASGQPIMDITGLNMKNIGSTVEVAFLIPGSTAWSNSAPLTIDITKQLDRANNNIMRISVVDALSANAVFGNYARGANVLVENGGVGQQFDELLISQQAGAQQLVVVRGKAYSGALDLNLTTANSGVQTGDAETIRVYPANGGGQGFGSYFDAIEFDGKVGADLVIQHQTNLLTDQASLTFIRGAEFSQHAGAPQLGNSFTNAVLAAVGSVANFFTIAGGYQALVFCKSPQNVGNFFDNPAPGLHTDIVYARQKVVGLAGAGQQVILRTGLPRSETGSDAVYPYEDLIITDPFVPGNSSFGTNPVGSFSTSLAPAGDFDKDGFPDLVIGSADTGAVKGSTLIVH